MEAGFDVYFLGILFMLALFIWSARSRFRDIDAFGKRSAERDGSGGAGFTESAELSAMKGLVFGATPAHLKDTEDKP